MDGKRLGTEGQVSGSGPYKGGERNEETLGFEDEEE